MSILRTVHHHGFAGRAVAVLAACALLANSIYLAAEYTPQGGASLTSTIAALCGLAAFPLFIGSAIAHKQRAAAWSMALATIGFLLYSFPATTGRAIEARQERERVFAQSIEQRGEYKQALAAMRKECATGNGTRCKGWARTVSVMKPDSGTIASGDLGSQIMAWIFGLSSDVVRKLSAIAFALGSEMGIVGLMAFAGRPTRRRAKLEPEPEKHPIPEDGPKSKKPFRAEQWLRSHVKASGPGTVVAAWNAYQEEVSGRGGRKMSKRSFAELYARIVGVKALRVA